VKLFLTIRFTVYYNLIKNLNIVFANSARFRTFDPGELAEWSIAAVLKTVELLKVPGVRIPNSPPSPAEAGYGG
jgi:hypothetical protein